ncbi:uncharacterized protein LOC142011452 isoform X2 [Carettochelys insculpta]|uniref:uncharacterized protein LOC142011452 isoform X2 n=1 Tax=Carettochelys insculpta TaxID=44489 RepID=UPI003EB7A6D9
MEKVGADAFSYSGLATTSVFSERSEVQGSACWQPPGQQSEVDAAISQEGEEAVSSMGRGWQPFLQRARKSKTSAQDYPEAVPLFQFVWIISVLLHKPLMKILSRTRSRSHPCGTPLNMPFQLH